VNFAQQRKYASCAGHLGLCFYRRNQHTCGKRCAKFANGENMNIITCRMNKNHMAQFEKLDGFVVFNFTRKLDARKFGTYEVSIRKLSHNKPSAKRSKAAASHVG
jgi:hypothetical protein